MQLSKLLSGLDGEIFNMKETEVHSIECDSRNVTPGALFVSIVGERFDGHNFIGDALRRGAVAIVAQRRVFADVPEVVVKDTRSAMGRLAKLFYDTLEGCDIIGITGTNGKTTTSFLIHSVLAVAGKKPGLIGTIYYLGAEKLKATRTTPESLDIFKLLRKYRDDGAAAVVMEVSSHALSLKRVDEVRFRVAVFTNLSQDHLDFHKTLDDYGTAKLRIFSLLHENGVAVYNNDDPVKGRIDEMNLRRRIRYGFSDSSDVQARVLQDTREGLMLDVLYRGSTYRIRSHLVGTFNVYNVLASFATCVALDIHTDAIITGIDTLQSIQGRMEPVAKNVFVDFAHTPSAIEFVLKSLRQYTQGRLIIVFGCGGDRDREKRPRMGAYASDLADFVVITSDNPRSESPQAIINDIKKGIAKSNYVVVEDRRAAIHHALSLLTNDDILVVAGKGHEEYQIQGTALIPFSDTEVIKEWYASS